MMSLEMMSDHHNYCPMAFRCELCLDLFPTALIDDHFSCCSALHPVLTHQQQSYQKEQEGRRQRNERQSYYEQREENKLRQHGYESTVCRQGQPQFPYQYDQPQPVEVDSSYGSYDEVEEPEGSRGSGGLSEREINSLTTDSVREGREREDCDICTREKLEGDFIIRLPCCHTYHTDCLVPWLQMHPTYPSCKLSLSQLR